MSPFARHATLVAFACQGGGCSVQQGDVVVDVVVSRAVPPAAAAGSNRVTPVTQRRPGERITVLTLSWALDDPLAVNLTLNSTPDHPALPRGSWVVLRDFLRYGLDEATGDGAVHIQPEPGRQRVLLRLARPGRPAWVSAPCSVLRSFLDQTDALDPTGEGRSAEALDLVIDRLLQR